MDDEPQHPGVFEYLWVWFCELHGRRGGGFGPSPITWSDIYSWATITRRDPTPWDISTIMKIDNVYLKYAGEKAKKDDREGE